MARARLGQGDAQDALTWIDQALAQLRAEQSAASSWNCATTFALP
jgi:hypothetical protein